ncbi:MAG TPA: protein phosphatase 2C domain-containing protein [Waterburya sp.]|jgi:serine/threonine protein phosphatase PrpC
MEIPAATIYCSNTRCQAPNPQSNKFCQQCRTPLTKRYLWAIGQGIEAFKSGEAIANRYVLVYPRILLDTQPGTPPETPPDIPPSLAPYLRLAPYALHIPQVYGRLMPSEGRNRAEIWLLEDAPLYSSSVGWGGGKDAPQLEGQVLPELTNVWKDAPAVRQLNWLWQLATLWQPLKSEGVASSLLSPQLLRVEGSIIRLLELHLDTKPTPTLSHLGQLWSQWIPSASPDIAGFLQQISNQLTQGQIRTSEQLVSFLDQALKDNGRSQVRSYQIFTRSDSGPTRPHNEDACYPPSGQMVSSPPTASALAIVCDGIGGHEGGEVASHLAINTLREQVEKLPNNPDNWNPTTLTLDLERATCIANDLISQQNDSEHRSDRQRMGTTVVMARTVAHEVYITHVGDSRVYWITRHNCHQITLDDDLASREVRLGYALYRNAVQQPTSGSLVQALGMAPSTTLHPTVQRFVLDEDCVFLLCSDGLSDNDRVDQHWQTEILPILEGRIDLPTAGARLIEIANTQNGYDNATIALLYCKVTPSNGTSQPQSSASQTSVPTSTAEAAPTLLAGAAPSQMKTQQLTSKASSRRPWGLLLGILVLLGLGGVLAYFLVPGVSDLADPLLKQVASNSSPPTEPSDTGSSSSTPAIAPNPSASVVSALEQGAILQVSSSTPANAQRKNIPLVLRKGLPPQNQAEVGVVPAGSIVEVIKKQPDAQQNNWLEVRVCSLAPGPSGTKSSPGVTASVQRPPTQVGKPPVVDNPKPTPVNHRQLKPGETGWLKEADVLPHINPNFTPTPAQQSECAPPSPSSVSTPTAKPT